MSEYVLCALKSCDKKLSKKSDKPIRKSGTFSDPHFEFSIKQMSSIFMKVRFNGLWRYISS